MLFLSVVAAGLYGIVHDQITATIAPEYYTKYKFIQFGIGPSTPFRTGVSLVGFYATWWVGGIAGLLFGLTAFIYTDHISMKRAIKRALFIIAVFSAMAGAIGYIIARFLPLRETGVPIEIQDKQAFLLTGTVHNFGYVGAVAGLMAGFIYLLWKRFKVIA